MYGSAHVSLKVEVGRVKSGTLISPYWPAPLNDRAYEEKREVALQSGMFSRITILCVSLEFMFFYYEVNHGNYTYHIL